MIPNSQLPSNKQIRIAPARDPAPATCAAPPAAKNSHTMKQKIQFLDAFRAGVERYRTDRLTTTEVATILTAQLGFPVTMSQVRELRENLGEVWSPRSATRPANANAARLKYRECLAVLFGEVARLMDDAGFAPSDKFRAALAIVEPPAVKAD